MMCPNRSPGFRIVLLPAPSQLTPVAMSGFVPGYSDGVAADSHRLPRPATGTRAPTTRATLTERVDGCNIDARLATVGRHGVWIVTRPY